MPTKRSLRTHPVTRYARRVGGDHRAGDPIAAGPLVRLAADRHLKDLADGQARGLSFDQRRATKAISFFQDYLTFPDGPRHAGRPFALEPWQQFVVGSLFGWCGPDGGLRYRTAYLELGKGNGKTPLSAGILLLHLLTARSPVQVYSAANSQKQAHILFRDLERMVATSSHLRRRVQGTVGNLAIPSTGSFVRVVSSEHRTLDGLRVYGCGVDEVHEQADPQVVDKISAGTKGIPDSLILYTTNSGYDRQSICWRLREYSRQVVEGTIEDDAWFSFVCGLDKDDDPFTDSTCWVKANPNVNVSVPSSYLEQQVREATGMPSKQNLVKRLNFCQWTDAATTWIPRDAWDACRDPSITVSSLSDREVYLGIDLSSKIDPSAVAILSPHPVEGADADTLNITADVIAEFFMPSNTLTRRAREDRVPYDEWEREGFLEATPGDLVDHDRVFDFISGVAERCHVRGIGVDMHGATALVTRLQRELGDLVVEIPQGFRHLSEPSKQFEALVLSKRLRVAPNAMLDWNVSNLAVETNKWNELRPVKLSQTQRIDGCVAIIDALAVMALKYEPEFVSVYETQEVFIV